MNFGDCNLPIFNECIEIPEEEWNRPNAAYQRRMSRDICKERLQFPPCYGRNRGLPPNLPRRRNECFQQNREYFPEETFRRIETFSPKECNAYIENLPNRVKYNTNEMPLEWAPPYSYNSERRFSRRCSHSENMQDSATQEAILRKKYLCAIPSYKQITNNQEMQSIPNYETFNEVSINKAYPISNDEQIPFTCKAEPQNRGFVKNVLEEGEYYIPHSRNDIANVTVPMQYPAQVVAHEAPSEYQNVPKCFSVCQQTATNNFLTTASNATETNPAMNDAYVSNIHVQDAAEEESIPDEIDEVLNSADENAFSVYFMKHLYSNLQAVDLSDELISDNNYENAVSETNREDLQDIFAVSDSEISKNIPIKNSIDLEMSLTTIPDEIVNSNESNLVSERKGAKCLNEKAKISDYYNNSVEERICLDASSLENVKYSQDKYSAEIKYLEANSVVQAMNLQDSNKLVKEQEHLKGSSKDEIGSLGEKYKSENEELNVIPTSTTTNADCRENKTEMKLDNSRKLVSNSYSPALNNEFHVTPNVTSESKFIFHTPIININQQNHISADNSHRFFDQLGNSLERIKNYNFHEKFSNDLAANVMRFFDQSANLLDRIKTDNFDENLSNYLAANVMDFLCALQGNSSTSLHAEDHYSEVENNHRNSQTSPETNERTEKISSEHDIISKKSDSNSTATEVVAEKANEFEYSNVLNSEALSSNIECSLSSVTNYTLKDPTMSSISLLDNIFESDDEYFSHFDVTSVKTLDKETINKISILEKCESLSSPKLLINNGGYAEESLNNCNDVKKNDNSNERLPQHIFRDAETQTLLTTHEDGNSFYMYDDQTQWNSSDSDTEFLSENRKNQTTQSNETHNERKRYKLQSTEIKCKQNYSTNNVATDKKKKGRKKVTLFCNEISWFYENPITSTDLHQTIKDPQRMSSKKNNDLTKSGKRKNLHSEQKSTKKTRNAAKRKLDQKQSTEQKHCQVRLKKLQFPEKADEKLVSLPSRKNLRTEQVSDTHADQTQCNSRDHSMSKISENRNKTFYCLRPRKKKQ